METETNWNDYDEAKAAEKNFITYPHKKWVYVGLQQGPVEYLKGIDSEEITVKEVSGRIRTVEKEGKLKGKQEFFALTDWYGMDKGEVNPEVKELTTVSAGFIDELRRIDEEGQLYDSILRIMRTVNEENKFKTKYRVEVVGPKPKEEATA